jgi:hypothetical protein
MIHRGWATEEEQMKKIVLAAAFSALAATAFAQEPAATCKAQSADKNLHGAAEKSFLTKCQKDATTNCNKQAADQKLKGAAKTSFTKKCVSDAVGA